MRRGAGVCDVAGVGCLGYASGMSISCGALSYVCSCTIETEVEDVLSECLA